MRISTPISTANINENQITVSTSVSEEVLEKMSKDNKLRVLRVPLFADSKNALRLVSFAPCTAVAERGEGEDHKEIVGQTIWPDNSYLRNEGKSGVWAFYIKLTKGQCKNMLATNRRLTITFQQGSNLVPDAPDDLLLAHKDDLSIKAPDAPKLHTMKFAQTVHDEQGRALTGANADAEAVAEYNAQQASHEVH